MFKKATVILVACLFVSSVFANHFETKCVNQSQNNKTQYYICCNVPYISTTTGGSSERPGIYWVYVSNSTNDCSQFNMTGSTECNTSTYGDPVYTHYPTSLSSYVGGADYCTLQS